MVPDGISVGAVHLSRRSTVGTGPNKLRVLPLHIHEDGSAIYKGIHLVKSNGILLILLPGG